MPTPDGEPLPFEQPLRGEPRLRGDQPVPCHPPDLRRAALTAVLGFPAPGRCLTRPNTPPSRSPGSASPPSPARLPKPKTAKPEQQHDVQHSRPAATARKGLRMEAPGGYASGEQAFVRVDFEG